MFNPGSEPPKSLASKRNQTTQVQRKKKNPKKFKLNNFNLTNQQINAVNTYK